MENSTLKKNTHMFPPLYPQPQYICLKWLNLCTSSLLVSDMEIFTNSLSSEQVWLYMLFTKCFQHDFIGCVFFFPSQLTLCIDPAAALWLSRRMCQSVSTLFASKGLAHKRRATQARPD